MKPFSTGWSSDVTFFHWLNAVTLALNVAREDVKEKQKTKPFVKKSLDELQDAIYVMNQTP